MTTSGDRESFIACQTSQGFDVRGTMLRVDRFKATFEIYSPQLNFQMSEVLGDFRIVIQGRQVYCGRAVICGLVPTGTLTVCEVTLDESGLDRTLLSTDKVAAELGRGFDDFLNQWQKNYKVLSEYKVVIADMQTFLMDLRLWLGQVELEIRSSPAGERQDLEKEALQKLGPSIVPAFDAMHERLEAISDGIEEGLRPVHQHFAKRQLHPLVLCSPFAYRTHQKPLGYAGDYEMVNMILRDPHEGGSLFAKIMNLWFLSQWPARAHRNRIQQLKETIFREITRRSRAGLPARILNLGCGPAREVAELLQECPLIDQAQFTLLDFNEETVQYTSGLLHDVRRRFGRNAPIQVLKKSVAQLMKDAARPGAAAPEKQFDMIYCAGLFDYLSDRTCRQLMAVFHQWVAPGGLILTTNVDACRPFRNMLEFVLDWNLIYRNEHHAAALVPAEVLPEHRFIKRDETGVNLFIEVRKPDDVQ